MSVITLAAQIKSDLAVKTQWQEALTNIANKALRTFKAARVCDGIEFSLAHIKRATVLNDEDYNDALGQKPKLKTCRTLQTLQAPSHAQLGGTEKVVVIIPCGLYSTVCGHRHEIIFSFAHGP